MKRSDQQKSPRALAGADAGRTTRQVDSNSQPVELASLANLFAAAWDEAARRFLSCFFHDTFAGHAAAVDAGLSNDDFPRVELWWIAEELGLCALAGIQHPGLDAIIGDAEEAGLAVCATSARELDYLEHLECSAAGSVVWGATLKDFARRRALATALWRGLQSLLTVPGHGADVDQQPGIVTRILKRRGRTYRR